MKANEVAKLLQDMGLPDKMNPYGFTISDKWRLECGSGIAGRTDFWKLVYIPTGRTFTEPGGYRLKGQLKAALKAWSDWHMNIEALAAIPETAVLSEEQAWMASLNPRPELVAVSTTVWGIKYKGEMVCAPTIQEAVSVLRNALLAAKPVQGSEYVCPQCGQILNCVCQPPAETRETFSLIAAKPQGSDKSPFYNRILDSKIKTGEPT